MLPAATFQRAALLLANQQGLCRVRLASGCAAVAGLRDRLRSRTRCARLEPVFCTTPGGEMGGIWQAGNGPAVDAEGNLYFMTGNGSFDPAARSSSAAFSQVEPDLAAARLVRSRPSTHSMPSISTSARRGRC